MIRDRLLSRLEPDGGNRICYKNSLSLSVLVNIFFLLDCHLSNINLIVPFISRLF